MLLSQALKERGMTYFEVEHGAPHRNAYYGYPLRSVDSSIIWSISLFWGGRFIRINTDISNKLYVAKSSQDVSLRLPADSYIDNEYLESIIGMQFDNNINYHAKKMFSLDEWKIRARALDLFFLTKHTGLLESFFNFTTWYRTKKWDSDDEYTESRTGLLGNGAAPGRIDGNIWYTSYTLPTKTTISYKNIEARGNCPYRRFHLDIYGIGSLVATLNQDSFYDFGYQISYDDVFRVASGDWNDDTEELTLYTVFNTKKPSINISTHDRYMFPAFFSVFDFSPNLTYFGGL